MPRKASAVHVIYLAVGVVALVGNVARHAENARRPRFIRIAVGRNDVVDSISYTDDNFGDEHHTRMSIELDKVKTAVGNGRGRSMIAALIAREIWA
jgi:hypothetical protein